MDGHHSFLDGCGQLAIVFILDGIDDVLVVKDCEKPDHGVILFQCVKEVLL